MLAVGLFSSTAPLTLATGAQCRADLTARTVTHDDHLVDGRGVLCQDDIDSSLACYGDALGLVSYEGYDERPVGGRGDREGTLGRGGHTRRRAVDKNGRADDRLPVHAGNTTRYLPVLRHGRGHDAQNGNER